MITFSDDRDRGELAKWMWNLSHAFAFLIPLKLSLSYIALIPFLILGIIEAVRGRRLPRVPALLIPFYFFLLSAFLSSLFGVQVGRSIGLLVSLGFFSLASVFIAEQFLSSRSFSLLFAVLCGEAIAALYRVGQAIIPGLPEQLFLGAVTESGQLALTLPLAVGFLVQSFRDPKLPYNRGLLTIIVLLLTFAFFYNLKRGPWAGVGVGLALFFSLYLPKFLPALVGIALAVASLSEAVRKRLLDSSTDFFMAGGRSTIWEVGETFISRFPLGVGFGNSRILRDFAPEIPRNLTHFHNNILNLTAEVGWLSASLFIWWIWTLLEAAFKFGSSPITKAIGCAILSSQIAGLVEYNFGDSEVLLLTFLLVGNLAGLTARPNFIPVDEGAQEQFDNSIDRFAS